MLIEPISFPKGEIENILVRVHKFIFLADFVILDMEEDKNVPIIMGRPFLATGRTLIDVAAGELIMRVNDEQVVFNIFKAMKYPIETDDCFALNQVDQVVAKFQKRNQFSDLLEHALTSGATPGEEDEVDEDLAELMAWRTINQKKEPRTTNQNIYHWITIPPPLLPVTMQNWS